MSNWIPFFMGMAKYIATASKDPSTQVGCVIARPDWTVASMGYNGFPRGVGDYPARYEDRPTKYKMVVHAEANAITHAREPLHGMTMFTTLMPCSGCAGLIIQAGISTIITPKPSNEHRERWGDSFRITQTMFQEAGVELLMLTDG